MRQGQAGGYGRTGAHRKPKPTCEEHIHAYTFCQKRLMTTLNHPTTVYFRHVRVRPDRSIIQDEWINRVISDPEFEAIQPDGRVRYWKRFPEAGGRALRVILLADQITIHNAFFDRGFREVGDEGHVF
jgi:hypothetical protein